MAQSALRCSCAVLSVGARGSTAGLGVKVALAGLVSSSLEPLVVVVVVEAEVFEGEAGVFDASRKERVVVSCRIFELAAICNSHGV